MLTLIRLSNELIDVFKVFLDGVFIDQIKILKIIGIRTVINEISKKTEYVKKPFLQLLVFLYHYILILTHFQSYLLVTEIKIN